MLYLFFFPYKTSNISLLFEIKKRFNLEEKLGKHLLFSAILNVTVFLLPETNNTTLVNLINTFVRMKIS